MMWMMMMMSMTKHGGTCINLTAPRFVIMPMLLMLMMMLLTIMMMWMMMMAMMMTSVMQHDRAVQNQTHAVFELNCDTVIMFSNEGGPCGETPPHVLA